MIGDWAIQDWALQDWSLAGTGSIDPPIDVTPTIPESQGSPDVLYAPKSLRMAVSIFPWNDPAQAQEVRYLQNPSVTWRLNRPSSLQFSLPADYPQSNEIEDLITDALIRINGIPISRFRCGKTVDNAGSDLMSTNFPFIDYRGVLERRYIRAGMTLAYTADDQSDIVWGIVSDIQSVLNGDYGITRGVGAVTGVLRDWTLERGDKSGNVIQSIAAREGGFDWDINGDMELDLFYPQRGEEKDVVLEYGKNVIAFSRSRETGSFGNHLEVFGSEATTPVTVDSPTVLTDPQGVWDLTASYPDVTIQDSLQDRADWLIDVAGDPIKTYSLQLASGFWGGPDQFFIGDTVQLRIRRGRINEFLPVRITEISYSQDGDGGEVCRVMCGSLGGQSDIVSKVRDLSLRLDVLERKASHA